MSRLTLHWDERHELWQGHVDPPGTGSDPAIGPPGPAGVSAFHAGDATFNTCTMTGRVTDVYLPAELGQGERDAIEAVFEDDVIDIEALVSRREHPSFDLEVRPVSDRQLLVGASDLLDAVHRIDLSDQREALALAWIELAATLGEMATRKGSLSLFDVEGLVVDVVDTADRMSGQLRPTNVRTDVDSTRARTIIEQLEAARRVFPGLRGDMAVWFLTAVASRRARRAGLLDDAAVDLAPPDLPTANTAPDVVAVRSTTPGDDFELDRDAAHALGLRPEVQVRRHGPWLTVLCRDDERDDRAPAIWIRAFDDQHRLVGADQLTGPSGTSSAQVAITPGATVIEWEFESNPFGRPERSVPYGRLDHAVGVSRAAWVAHRSRPTEHEASGLAEVLFAQSAVAWLSLGEVFRAAWAWSLADQGDASKAAIAALGGADLHRAIDAVIDTGDVPLAVDPPAATPVPLWMRAARASALVPRPTR